MEYYSLFPYHMVTILITKRKDMRVGNKGDECMFQRETL